MVPEVITTRVNYTYCRCDMNTFPGADESSTVTVAGACTTLVSESLAICFNPVRRFKSGVIGRFN